MEFFIKLFVTFVTFLALCDASPILNTFGNQGSPSPGRNLAFRNDKNDASFEQPGNWKSRHVYQKPIYLDPHGDFDKKDDKNNHEIPSAVDDSSDGLVVAYDRNNIQMHPLYNSDPGLNLKVQAQPDNSIEDQKAINIFHNNEIAHNLKENNIQNVKSLNENDLNAISNTRTKKSARVVQELVAPQHEQSKQSSNKKVKGKKYKVPIADPNVVLVKTNINDIRSDERILHQDSWQNLYSSPNEFYYNEKPNVNNVKPIKSKTLSSGGVHFNKNPDSSRIYPIYISGNVEQPYNIVENHEVVVPNDHKKKQHGLDKNIARTLKASKSKGNLYTIPNMDNSPVQEPQSKHSNKKAKGKKSVTDSEINNYSDYKIKSSNDKAFDERSGNLQKNLYTSPHEIDYSENNPHNIHYQKQQAGNLYPLYNIDTHVLHTSVPVKNKNLQAKPANVVENQKISEHLPPDQTIDNIGPRHNYINEKVNDNKSVVFEKQKKKYNSGRKILIPIREKKFFYQAQPVLPEPDRNNEETIYYIN